VTSASERTPAGGESDPTPVVPDIAFEDSDAAWGDYPQDSDDWLRGQRPPHHGG